MKKNIAIIITSIMLFILLPLGIKAAELGNADKKVKVPVVEEEYVYNGIDQIIIEKENGFIVQGNQGKDVGDYEVVLSLEDGYVWNDNSTVSKKLSWKIVPAKLKISKVIIEEKLFDGKTDAKVESVTITDQKGNIYQGTLNITAEFESAEIGNQKKVTVNISVPEEDLNNVSVNKTTITTKGNIIRKTIEVPKKTKPSGEPSYVKITEEGKTLADANLEKGTIGIEGKISWVFPESTKIEANKDYSWTFVPDDLNKYEIISGRILLYEVKEEEKQPETDNNSQSTDTSDKENTENNNNNNNNNNQNTNTNNNASNNNTQTGNNTGSTNNNKTETNTNTNNSTNNNTNNSTNSNTTVNTGNNSNTTNNKNNNNNNNTVSNNSTNNNVSGNTTNKPANDKKKDKETDKRTEQQKLLDEIKDKTRATLTNNVTKKKEDIRIEIRVSYPENKITDSMKKQGISSSDQISERLKSKIKENTNIDGENNVLYDISLIYTEDYGKTWNKGTKDKFPKDGYLKVSIPIPGQLNPDDYDFAVAHMFSNEDFGKIAGEIEIPPVTKRTDEYGIHYLDFYVTGLSPIMVSWQEISQVNNETEDDIVLDDLSDEQEAATVVEEEVELTKDVKVKLAIAIGVGVLFTILTLWIAKKIAWG